MPQEPTLKLLSRVWLAALCLNEAKSNIRGDDIGSGYIGMSLAFELSAVGWGVDASVAGLLIFHSTKW